MLSVAYPWVLLLAPLPWLLRPILPPRRVALLAVRVPFGERLKFALQTGSTASRLRRRSGRQLVSVLIWLLVLAALARPQWLQPAVSRELPTRDLLLLVDLSGSMRQQDFTNAAGVRIDRLRAVQEVLGDFLSRRTGDRVGLVVFGDTPFLQVPFTTDLELSRRLLEETAIGMAGARTAFGDAIGLGLILFEHSNAPAKTIIALTDGNDSASQVPPIEAARVARERGVTIHAVAIGDPTTVGEEKLDQETLRAVAQTTGGNYFFAADRAQLENIYTELDRIETRKVDVVSHRPWRDLFFWPLLAALLLSLGVRALALYRHSCEALTLQASGRVHVDPLTGRLEVQA
ncbi:MAG: VWA domain-containing protein [Pseudomonadales bacterium]|nr:VWA domain-containing protein [Pseudomonadales bacterium]